MKLNGCEELWLNIKTNDISNQKFTVGVIYRHPNYSNSTVKEFSEALCNSINKITNRKDTFYLLGNLNIDLTVNKRSLSSLYFLNSLISCGSLPIITIPTRVTETSATIIDHVITRRVDSQGGRDPPKDIHWGVQRVKDPPNKNEHVCSLS